MKRIASFLVLLLLLCAPVAALSVEGNKWSGVDESVVERIAKEHGRAPRPPLINTDQGDLLLFVFLLAGAFGGFTAGYYWRKIAERRPETQHEEK